MPITFTTPTPFGNGTRAVIRMKDNPDDSEIELHISIRSPAGTDIIYAERSGVVRNGRSSSFSRVTLTPGRRASEVLTENLAGVLTPTGYTTAKAALAVSRQNFELHLLALGVLDSTMVGT